MELQKILDTSTPRKKGLNSFYMLGVTIPKMLNLDEDAQHELFIGCIEVAKKLAKMADAVDDYLATEERELEALLQRAREDKSSVSLIHSESSSKLEAATEEALAQAKSALDVAVKVLKPVAGINFHTYGNAGEAVTKALRNNLPDNLKKRAQGLITTIEENQEWIVVVKKLRDDQHYKNIEISPIKANGMGHKEASKMPGGQAVSEFLEVAYYNAFMFLQEFLASAMYIQMIPGLAFVIQGEDFERTFQAGITREALESADGKHEEAKS